MEWRSEPREVKRVCAPERCFTNIGIARAVVANGRRTTNRAQNAFTGSVTSHWNEPNGNCHLRRTRFSTQKRYEFVGASALILRIVGSRPPAEEQMAVIAGVIQRDSCGYKQPDM